jgi:hypothetical protein
MSSLVVTRVKKLPPSLAIHAVFVQLDAQCLDSTRTHAPELQPFRRTGEEDDQGDGRLENCRATSHPRLGYIGFPRPMLSTVGVGGGWTSYKAALA